MGEDSSEPIEPQRWHFGIEILRWDYLTVYMWGPLRFLWYDPRDRDNWKFDPVFNRETWQIGIGPAVVALVWD